ncbi:MAG: SLC13 family permease [archaeon]|nr:SLC13 family permease [archaeon]
MNLAVVLAIFVLTYALLIFRKIRGRQIPIWVSMVAGAFLMVATLSISPINAFKSIDFSVLGFLFGMLIITAGFEKSGLINYIVLWILARTKTIDGIILAVVIGSGFLSAFFVNDTIALLWTPIVLGIATKIGLKEKKALLIPLAFGITIGSTFTPIGNPQNLLVALDSGMQRPFASFIEFLAIPTFVSLIVVYYVCKSKLFFGRLLSQATLSNGNIPESELQNPSSAISDWLLAKESAIVLIMLLASFAITEAFPAIQSLAITIGGIKIGVTISSLAFAFGILLLIISPKREYLLVSFSWSVLVFFAGMFVVMSAVWNSGIGKTLLNALPSPVHGNNLQSVGAIMPVSIILSQILSNVPFVQLYSFQMHNLGFGATDIIPWLAVAAGSTLAGNLTVLGAVSNVIIIDSAENRKEKAFGFLEFVKYGALITVVTALIFTVFLAFI